MPPQDYEKLGLFYLGRVFDLERDEPETGLLLYDSKDLTTHAVCVGMTGSGKTGLCLVLIEEAAIDGIPVIAIDPKGDLGNLLLTFPELRSSDFRPWIDPAEAARRGMTPDAFAEATASRWREGLEAWGQPPERIARFREAADLAIYTPGSTAGLPLTIMRSFAAPPPALREQSEAFRERITSSVSGLLALLGIAADPVSSREHILLANILDQTWRAGRDLDLAGMIRAIQEPPFRRLGVMDLDSAFPAKDRFALAMRLNNLLASPGFSAWMEGEPLDIGALLATRGGKPRVSILSIAHLSENERMFFVTILLNEVLAWVRTQPGTSSLRAILYMDEIFGYFPPTANPPSKTPMLTLLKQARAYGLGVVLATQNPVDLDYKGLSNAGTWFLGRLQTERDKARVLEGLEGASAAAGAVFDRARMEATLAGLRNRVFLMNNVHEDAPVVFQTRWALSYLRGPLTRDQIRTLMGSERDPAASPESVRPTMTVDAPKASAPTAAAERPILPPEVTEVVLAQRAAVRLGESLVYRPALLGLARLHFVHAKSGVNEVQAVALLRPMVREAPLEDPWEDAEVLEGGSPELEMTPNTTASFLHPPESLLNPRSYKGWTNKLKDHLYRERRLTIWHAPQLDVYARAGESERDFRLRLAQASRERRDLEVEKLRARFAPRLRQVEDRIRKAELKLRKEQAKASRSTMDAAVSFGSSLLHAITGRKLRSSTNVGRAATSARAATRAMEQRQGVAQAAESLDDLKRTYEDLETEFQCEVDRIEMSLRPDAVTVVPIEISLTKSRISVDPVVLAWTPWRVDPDGRSEPAYV